MADRVVPGPVESSASIREAVCITTKKIYDSCRDKDCVDDLRVYPTVSSQSYIENALSIRPKSAELLYVDVNVEPIGFNRGYYTVDCTYFYRVICETFPAGQRCTGLAIFDKRVMLFGSEGSVKSFSSGCTRPLCVPGDLPTAVVNSVDPIALHSKIVDSECLIPTDVELRHIPEFITAAFDEPLVLTDTARRWFVTIGQFSIIRLERDTQLLIPAYDYCMPDKECPGVASDDDPCMLFSRIRFPVEEFFPPDSVEDCDDYRTMAAKAK
ncbi:MAG: hypothetical protein J6J62_09145 [Oscillospiraceae bacterium]|nr:hypothetical protein [Oscillospiraceae bacterium]